MLINTLYWVIFTMSFEQIKQSVTNGATNLANNFREGAGRLGSAIQKGGIQALDSIKGQVLNIDMQSGSKQTLSPENDWRVRISLAPESSAYF